MVKSIHDVYLSTRRLLLLLGQMIGEIQSFVDCENHEFSVLSVQAYNLIYSKRVSHQASARELIELK